ncbi:MAG: PKD-like domain-containing protein [Bacteroidota bacterium]
MRKCYLAFLFLFICISTVFAQPANDNCSTAQTILPNGSCNSGTTVGADDSWNNVVACQSGNNNSNHRDVWYSFVATGDSLRATITAGTLTGNIEFILVSGTCGAASFALEGSFCGSSPLTGSITGLTVGTTYFYTISTNNTQGTFNTCVTTATPTPPPVLPGQDCNTAAILCNSNTFTQSTSNLGFGTQEVTPSNSCFGGGERQSKWFKFTAGCTGRLEFNINPTVITHDYDWAIWDISSDPTGCTTKGSSLACNWAGVVGGNNGSTGLSSCPTSENGALIFGGPGFTGDPCTGPNRPRSWYNWGAPYISACLSNTLTVTAGKSYALLVDNYTSINSGFTLDFGGACGTGTAVLGPKADFTYTVGTCGTYNFTKVCQTTNSTFLWQFGDGATSNSQNPSHTYTTFGNFTISLLVTDALGCTDTYSQIINIVSTPLPTITTPETYCQNAIAVPLTATGTSLLWYTTATLGTGSSTAPTPSTASTGTTSYYVSQTIAGCESPRAQIDVIVNATPAAPAVTTPVPYCQGGTASALTATGTSLLWYTTATLGVGSATAPTPSTASVGSTTYYVSQTVTGCESPRAAIVVNINAAPAAPGVTTPVPYCQGAIASTLSATGTTLLWYTTATLGVGSATAPTPSTAAAGSTTYYVSQTVAGCEGPRAAIVVNINATPAAPAVTTPVIYCQGVTASALTATGTTLLWYTTATLGVGSSTAPTPSTASTGSTTYYVSQTVAGCEGARAAIVVTVNTVPPAPGVTTPVPYCQGVTASALTATGTSLLWYTTATLGVGSATAPTPSTASVGSTTYYVSQTVTGCESPRAAIVVNINAAPAAPGVTTPVPYCQGAIASTLSATGTTLLWYTTATLGVGSATAPTPSTAAAGSTTYYVSQTVAGCEGPRAAIVVNINSSTHNAFTEVQCDTYTWNGTPYTASGDYTYNYTNGVGCPSVDTLHLTINYGTHNAFTEVQCDTYTWNGTPYTSSGNYTYSYINGVGCPSVDTLHLTVNYGTHNSFTETACETYSWNGTPYTVSGDYTYSYSTGAGCPAVDTLHLTINYGTHNAFTEVQCETYTWNGTPYTASGDYTYNYTNGVGCPSVDTLHLTINYGTHNAFTEVQCDTYTWNSNDYTTSGTYTYNYINGVGCPSVDTLHLTINYGTHNSFIETACETYSWNGTPYTVSGDYTYSYSTGAGCPAVDTLHLTINYGTHNAFTEVQCETFTWHGTPYTVSGDYTYSYTNGVGCPSVDTLHLTINYGTHNVFTEVQCDTYTWNGTPYTSSGTYTYSYINGVGCPSVDTLHLTINYGTHNSFTEVRCETYTWNGTPYTVSGDYTYSYSTGAGCPAVDTLHLTINYGTYNAFTEVQCDTYTWNGTPYTASGDYTYNYTNGVGCPSVDTLHLTINYGTHNAFTEVQCDTYTWNGTPYTSSGNYTYSYTNAAGCPSVDTLHLTINYGTHNAFTETACETYSWNGTPYTVSGDYTYSYSTGAGCPAVDTLHLTINMPTASNQPITVCNTYTWNGVTYTTSGIYSKLFVGGNSKGCDSTANLNLTIINPITPIFNQPDPICSGALLNDLPNTSTNSITGTWSPALNNTATTIYTFTPTTGQCANTATLTITVIPIPVMTSSTSANICSGAAINIPLTSNIPSLFTWQAINNPSTTGESLSLQTSGVLSNTIINNSSLTQTVLYNVIPISLTGNCPAGVPQTITISINPEVLAFAGNDTSVLINKPYQLMASGGVNYLWSPGSLLNNRNIPNPITTLSADTRFDLEVTDALGCKAWDTVFIKVYEGPTYYVPSAFSPNGDGLNDVFRPVPVGIVSTEWFRVFNRWGELVFESNAWMKGWNGIYKNIEQPEDTYIWIIKGKNIEGKEVFMKGAVVLVR